MRPLRLDVEGFTCYRDRQPVLDFSGLNLFAIAGPTGAGKSSILDTMLYALYGQVPRLGKQGIAEVISHGRDALSVCLDFAVQGHHYRVTRRVKRRGKANPQTTALFVEVVDGAERPIAEGVREVNNAVRNVLGLGYDDFVQTVILPQGEFARFLRAEPRSQREILQNLLRHGIFESMRRKAEEQKNELTARLKGIEGQLATYEDATKEALGEQEKALADARERLSAALAEKDAATAHLDTTRELHKLTTEVQTLRAQRQELERQAPAIDQAREELENARKAAAIGPRLESLEQAERRLASAKRDCDDAAAALTEAEAARTEAARRLETATKEAETCEDLALRVRRLDEISGDVARRAELAAQLEALPAQLDTLDSEFRKAQADEKAARKAVERHEKRAGTLKAERDALAFDESLYSALAAKRDEIADARSLQRALNEAVSEAERAALSEAEASRDEHKARETHDAAQARADSAGQALQAAQAARDDARNRHSAAALRAHLHVGENCPVCLQVVATPPAAEPLPELEALEAAYTEAQRRAQNAERERQKAHAALATATARREEAARRLREAQARVAERTQALNDRLKGIAAVAGAAVAPAALLAWVNERWTELQHIKVERDRIENSLRQAHEDLSASRLALASATAAAQQASERRERIVQDEQRLRGELDAVIERITAVTTHADPRAEREAIQEHIERLQTAVTRARDAHVKTELAMRSAEERLNAARDTCAQAETDLQAARKAVTDALAEAGFADIETTKAAARTSSQQRALEQRVTSFDSARAAVLQRLADLEPRIAGRETSDAALRAAQERYERALQDWREADQAVTRLEAACQRLREAVSKRCELMEERETVQQRLNVTAELAADLRGDRFQQYLLEEAFKSLVAGASVRMKAISNRYTLEWDAGEFYVVDHDNAGERRRAETLSGGETFMASLCLALQLSEEVLRTSGALQMDSLFIDEGFGTLDADSLAEVTDAIEALRHEGGRIIGIISHRPELTDRLPGCIRVIKGAGESTWTLERVG